MEQAVEMLIGFFEQMHEEHPEMGDAAELKMTFDREGERWEIIVKRVNSGRSRTSARPKLVPLPPRSRN